MWYRLYPPICLFMHESCIVVSWIVGSGIVNKHNLFKNTNFEEYKQTPDSANLHVIFAVNFRTEKVR